MENFKSFISLLLIGLLALSCATQKPLKDRPPAFDREACLEDKIKKYLHSGQSFLDSSWYYREAYPLPFPSYTRSLDSLKNEAKKHNIPVKMIRHDAPCPTVDSTMSLKWGTPLLHEYCKKCDSIEQIQKIIFVCMDNERDFLLDSLNLPDPNSGDMDLNSEEQLKMNYLNDRYKKSYNLNKEVVGKIDNWNNNHHH